MFDAIYASLFFCEKMSSRKVTRRSEYSDLFTIDQCDLLYDRCVKVMDITFSARIRNAAKKKPCFRLWDEKWASSKELNIVLKHYKMRKELGLIGDITIEEDYKYGMKKIATLLMLNL